MKLIVDKLAIEYWDEGQGSVAVLLHGWGSQAGVFDELTADLVTRYRVVRLDLPGFGSSQRPPETWGVGEYAGLVTAWLQKLGITEVSLLVGHSFGGRVAIKLAAAPPVPIGQLVLLNAAGAKTTAETWRKRGYWLVAKTGKAATSLPGLRRLRESSRSKLYQAAGATDYLHAGPLQQIFLNTVNEDLLPAATKIKVPTLLIYGGQDTETPPSEGRLLAGAITGSQLEILPGAGHYSFVDQQERVEQLIAEATK